MLKKSKKVFAGLLCLIMMMTIIPGNFVFGEETKPENDYLGVARKSQYVLYASSKENGIQLNGKNYVINGNVHSNSDVAAYLDKLDVRGKLEASGKVINYNNGVTQYIKKENAPERVLINPLPYIIDSLGANPTVHEYWQTYSNPTVENTTPIQAKSGLQFCASNVKLKDTIMANNDMMVSASEAFVSQENEEVLMCSANGNVSIYAKDIEINGIIYAPNGTVQICGTNVKINGMIIAKKIQISADNKLIINQNLNLKNAEAFKYYNDELQIYSEAEYDDTTETINVNWESTFDEGKYEVYSSTDNINFTLLGTVTGANTYAYKTNGSTNDIYFKVKHILNNGFTKESNTVKMVYDVYKCQYVFEDTDIDSERLTDTYEFFLETDMNNVDTDGDNLTDYAEVFLTGTDPLYKDSDEDGILDCDEDTDGDTLINKYEIKLGSNPQKVDTDDDTLPDNYEVAGIKIKGDDVNTYKTLPTNPDTDGDTISDSDEAILGLNPLLIDSDNDTVPDNKELFKQSVTQKTEENDNAIESITIDFDATLYAPKSTIIKSTMGSDMMSSNVAGLVGEPYDISTTSQFNSAKVTFKIKDSLPSTTQFSNLIVLWHNKDTGFFEQMPIEKNEVNHTITMTTTHFSEYMVVDGYKFTAPLRADLYKSAKKVSNYTCEFNTILAIDCSSNMSSSDSAVWQQYGYYSPYYYNQSDRTDFINSYISGLSDNEKVSLYTFTNNAVKQTEFTNNPIGTDDWGNKYFDTSIIYGNGLTDYNTSIKKMVDDLSIKGNYKINNTQHYVYNTIVLISDGKSHATQSTLDYAKSKGVIINTYCVEDSDEYYKNNLKLVSGDNGVNIEDKENIVYAQATHIKRDTLIALDCSEHVLNNDASIAYSSITGSNYIYKDCDRKKIVDDYLQDKLPKEKIGIYTFTDRINRIEAFKNNYSYYLPYSGYFDSTDIEESGNSNYDNVITQLCNQFPTELDLFATKSIIFISDGQGSISESTLQNAVNKGVSIYTVSLNNSEGVSTLEKIATETGGKNYQTITAEDFQNDCLSGTSVKYDMTTDGDDDGIPDVFETGGMVTKNHQIFYSDPTIKDSDGDGIKDGDEMKMIKNTITYTDLNNTTYYRFNYYFEMISDPNCADSDYDGIDDSMDEKPYDNKFKGIMKYDRGEDIISSNIEFSVDYSRLFKNNTAYNKDLAVLSSLLATDIYKKKDIIVTEGVKGGSSDVTELGKLFGLYDVEDINIEASDFSEDGGATVLDKDDLTEFVIGHRSVIYNGQTREVIVLVVRGTNGTNEEWSSNFDVGADTDEYYDMTGKHPNWLNKNNHKGFDVAANRVLIKYNDYLKRHNINNNVNKSILITGHSRGAAIANILGTYFENKSNYLSYTYTFAAPNTTTVAEDIAKSYKSIYNIVNKDDIIPQLPLEKWLFTKYGTTKSISVEEHYENKWGRRQKGTWEWLVGDDYNNDGGTQRTLDGFSKVAKDREALYIKSEKHYIDAGRGAEDSFAYFEKMKKDFKDEKLLKYCSLEYKIYVPDNTNADENLYYVAITYCPAYFMQILANMSTKVGPMLGRPVSGECEKARNSFIASSGKIKYKWLDLSRIGGMEDPHTPITYYLIAYNNFVNKV